MDQTSAAQEERVVRFAAQDGLTLAARIWGAPRPDRLPVLCLAGLSRNSRDFRALGRALAGPADGGRQVIALDARGRGLSDADPNWRNYTPLTESHDVLTAATVLGIERAVVVGTSRGGILAMILGALRPALLAGVVLNDIGPVIEAEGLARIRTYLAAARPMRSRDEAVAAVKRVAGTRFPALAEEDWRAMTEAFYVEADGVLRPDYDERLLRGLESLDSAEAIPVLWPQFDSLRRIPVLVVRGALSDIVSAETVAAMAARHPDLAQHTVEGQAHAPLLRDAPTMERIAAFVRRCDGLARA